jgi:isopenicillin-N N-acyltransferase-like protein
MESVGEKEIPSTLYRASRSRKLLSTDRGEIGTEILRSALQDHFGNPSSICKHTDESLPEVERKQTNASFIIDLENRRLLATRGPPCRSEYREYAL